MLLFIINRDDSAKKIEEFYNTIIKKVLATIDVIPHQLFAVSLPARDICPELKKYFYKENSNVTWEEFLTTKFGLWIDRRRTTDNTLHGSSRAVEKSGIFLQIVKAAKSRGAYFTCHVFTLKDTVAQVAISNPSGILTIEE